MKKNIYITPSINVINIQSRSTLLAGSSVDVSQQEYNSGSNGPVRSRSWYDDDDY